jgi:hypothetical protein
MGKRSMVKIVISVAAERLMRWIYVYVMIEV